MWTCKIFYRVSCEITWVLTLRVVYLAKYKHALSHLANLESDMFQTQSN